jgi:Ser/Thr protein kinase RdoA (MazF antagonist)
VEEVEAHWLETLRRDSDLAVPTLLPDRRGRHMTAGSHPLVPDARFCSVLTWVPGRIVRQTLDHATAREMGVISAQLHDQATSYLPPEVPAGIVANRVLYFGDTSRLARFESSYGSMFVEAVARVQDRLDALWRAQPHPPHLLHGDFGPQNVMRYRSRLTPIDFQDLQFGFDVQDIAITLADLRRLYSDESFVDAFMTGYRSVRSWPLNDPSLERALGAARSLNVINLGLNLRRAGLSEFIQRHAALVEKWMTGLAPKSAVI